MEGEEGTADSSPELTALWEFVNDIVPVAITKQEIADVITPDEDDREAEDFGASAPVRDREEAEQFGPGAVLIFDEVETEREEGGPLHGRVGPHAALDLVVTCICAANGATAVEHDDDYGLCLYYADSSDEEGEEEEEEEEEPDSPADVTMMDASLE